MPEPTRISDRLAASPLPPRVAGALGPLALAAAFASLAAWSWGRWTDVQIDFGNELYIAWQLEEGRALYRDIAYKNGPLSPHLNALWFQLFGVSVRTLVLCNLAILAALCAMVYRFFRATCGRVAATAACGVLLCVFAFSQYVGIANYNYVTPYQHDQTHGLALSIGMLLALAASFRRPSAGWGVVAGTCLGLVFLTKAELLVPAAVAAATAVGFHLASDEPRRGLRVGAALAGAAPVPAAVAFALLAREMPPRQALGGVLGNWRFVGTGITGDAFYRAGAGLDDVLGNLTLALALALGLAAFAGLALVLDVAVARRTTPGRHRWIAVALGVALFGALVGARSGIAWMALARALPVATAALAAALLAAHWRARGDPEIRASRAALVLWAVWGLCLLGKMALRARFHHYGFALAMPATLLTVVALAELGPGLARRRGGGALARALGLAAVGAFCVALLEISDARYAAKDFAVGRGGDAIVVDDPHRNRRGPVFARTLERLEELMPGDATLLAMPEGIGLNYWLRRRNPTRFNLFLPAEITAFGEDTMLAELRAHPPDFVALVHRNAAEFGVGPFGRDPRNGRRLGQWVRSHYRRVDRIGAEPFRGEGFGIVLLRRADPGEPERPRSKGPGQKRYRAADAGSCPWPCRFGHATEVDPRVEPESSEGMKPRIRESRGDTMTTAIADAAGVASALARDPT